MLSPRYLDIKTQILFSFNMERNADRKIDRITEICTHFDGVDTLHDGKKSANIFRFILYAFSGNKSCVSGLST